MKLLSIVLLASSEPSVWTIKTGEELVLVVLALVLMTVMAVVGAALLHLTLVLRQVLNPTPANQPADTRSTWQKVAGLHALNQEKDLVMEHAYDGIHELDNPTPSWFMGLFYGTIGFGVIYLMLFYVLGVGQPQVVEYTQEMAVAEQQREAYIKKVAGSINETTVARVTDPKSLEAGKAVFLQNCVACHGQQGQGGVGPNLTDEYWLHGGSVKAVFHTITEGVPEKGMMSWKKQLNPLQVQQVASYILSIQGSNPAGAKEPQGVKETIGVPALAEKVAVE